MLSEEEARSRKALAHHALALRDGLRSTERRSRSLAEAQRRHKLEVQVMNKIHGEQLLSERAMLDQHYGNQMKAMAAVSLFIKLSTKMVSRFSWKWIPVMIIVQF